MNDTISRQAAIAYAISGRIRCEEGESWIRVSEVRESLLNMPSAQPTTDAVEVVRCEKCKWQRKRLLDNGHYWYECGCGNESLGHDGEFCSDGERREDE